MVLLNSIFAKIFKKDLHKAIMTIGALYSGFSVFALLIVFMQKLSISSVEDFADEEFMGLMNMLHSIWITYMPLLLLLGLTYVLFGFMYNKITFNRFLINQIISVLFIAWAVAYAYGSVDYIKIFVELIPFQNEIISTAMYVMTGVGFVVVFLFMSVPQYLIGKMIKAKDEMDTNK